MSVSGTGADDETLFNTVASGTGTIVVSVEIRNTDSLTFYIVLRRFTELEDFRQWRGSSVKFPMPRAAFQEGIHEQIVEQTGIPFHIKKGNPGGVSVPRERIHERIVGQRVDFFVKQITGKIKDTVVVEGVSQEILMQRRTAESQMPQERVLPCFQELIVDAPLLRGAGRERNRRDSHSTADAAARHGAVRRRVHAAVR